MPEFHHDDIARIPPSSLGKARAKSSEYTRGALQRAAARRGTTDFRLCHQTTVNPIHQPNPKSQGNKEPTMKNDKRSEYITRDSILKLLSDDEVTTVSTAETAARLSDGDEYLDLERLDQGVQRASGKSAAMGRVLPRKSVHADTWNKILTQLPATHGAVAHVGT
jgi:hypothetical protein